MTPAGAHYIPIGVAPNIEVSLVVNPDEAALLAPRTAGFYFYEAWRRALRLAATPMFARRLRDKPEEPIASSIRSSGMMKV